MNASQRKWHGLIWLVIILVMPVILFLSVKDLNFSLSKTSNTIKNDSNTSNTLAVAENDLIKLTQFENSLEIILKKTLKHPTTLVYELDSNGKKGKFIGQLTASGRYKFDINKAPKGVLLFDSIKQSEITQLLF